MPTSPAPIENERWLRYTSSPARSSRSESPKTPVAGPSKSAVDSWTSSPARSTTRRSAIAAGFGVGDAA